MYSEYMLGTLAVIRFPNACPLTYCRFELVQKPPLSAPSAPQAHAPTAHWSSPTSKHPTDGNPILVVRICERLPSPRISTLPTPPLPPTMSPPEDHVRALIDTYHDFNPSVVDELPLRPSPLQFMRYVARNRPFVVRRGASSWRAVQAWDAGYLRKVMSRKSVQVAVTPNGYVGGLPCTFFGVVTGA
jgi:hypothetical protein